MNIHHTLNKFVSLCEEHLQQNLIGIYLHGSLAMGCFHPSTSDVDIIIVVRNRLTMYSRKAIIEDILTLEKTNSSFRMELSVVLEKEVSAFYYPTPFDIHYSKDHKEKYESDSTYSCADDHDSDLAAHFMVIYYRGIKLFGKAIHEVFTPIDRQYYIASCLQDVEDAHLKIGNKPVYYTLNLCRLLFYLREGVIASKEEGGQWARDVLPTSYYCLLDKSLSAYKNGQAKIKHNERQFTNFAVYMLKQIHQQLQYESISLGGSLYE